MDRPMLWLTFPYPEIANSPSLPPSMVGPGGKYLAHSRDLNAMDFSRIARFAHSDPLFAQASPHLAAVQ